MCRVHLCGLAWKGGNALTYLYVFIHSARQGGTPSALGCSSARSRSSVSITLQREGANKDVPRAIVDRPPSVCETAAPEKCCASGRTQDHLRSRYDRSFHLRCRQQRGSLLLRPKRSPTAREGSAERDEDRETLLVLVGLEGAT